MKTIVFDIEATNLAADFGILLDVGYTVYPGVNNGLIEVHQASIDPASVRASGRIDLADKEVAEVISEKFADADILVGHYIKKYDVPFLNTRLMYHNLQPLRPQTKFIDSWAYLRKNLKLHNNRLDSATHFFSFTEKDFAVRVINDLTGVSKIINVKGEKTGYAADAWINAAINPEALATVDYHNTIDVVVTLLAYEKLRGFVKGVTSSL
ncbi:MAG: ribonuclease H-like domain-containing protein [Candidatus Parvarchaeum sp.]